MPPLMTWIKECIDTDSWPFNSDIVGATHLAEVLPNHLRNIPPTAIGRSLKKLGAQTRGLIKLSSGNRVRVMSVRRHEMWEQAKDEMVAREYEKFSMSQEPGGNPLADSQPM